MSVNSDTKFGISLHLRYNKNIVIAIKHYWRRWHKCRCNDSACVVCGALINIRNIALPITIFIRGRLPENSNDLITVIITFLTNCSLVFKKTICVWRLQLWSSFTRRLIQCFRVISSFLIPEKCHSSRYLGEQNLKSNNCMRQKVHPPWSQCRPSYPWTQLHL